MHQNSFWNTYSQPAYWGTRHNSLPSPWGLLSLSGRDRAPGPRPNLHENTAKDGEAVYGVTHTFLWDQFHLLILLQGPRPALSNGTSCHLSALPNEVPNSSAGVGTEHLTCGWCD